MAYTVTKMLLTPNKWSRTQTKLGKVKGVVIHWVANTNTSATANRNFFENRKLGKTNFGSAHYIVGLKGEVIQCLPDNELAYHVGSETYTATAKSRLSSYPNNCTLGIECCHIADSGKMSQATWDTTVELSAKLLKEHGLDSSNLWLHKEVVGWKNCHKWFVDNPLEWVRFKLDVQTILDGKKNTTKSTTATTGGTKMVQWKIDMANNAIDALAKKGMINNASDWKKKVKDGTINDDLGWLTFHLVSLLANQK